VRDAAWRPAGGVCFPMCAVCLVLCAVGWPTWLANTRCAAGCAGCRRGGGARGDAIGGRPQRALVCGADHAVCCAYDLVARRGPRHAQHGVQLHLARHAAVRGAAPIPSPMNPEPNVKRVPCPVSFAQGGHTILLWQPSSDLGRPAARRVAPLISHASTAPGCHHRAVNGGITCFHTHNPTNTPSSTCPGLAPTAISAMRFGRCRPCVSIAVWPFLLILPAAAALHGGSRLTWLACWPAVRTATSGDVGFGGVRGTS